MEFDFDDWDKRDVGALAMKNPTPWDNDIQFKTNGHLYAIKHEGEWITNDISSVTRLLKYAFEDKMDMIAYNIYVMLHTVLMDYNFTSFKRHDMETMRRLLKTRSQKIQNVKEHHVGLVFHMTEHLRKKKNNGRFSKYSSR